MSAQNRRPSFSSSTTSSLAKRHASSSENVGKAMAAPSHLAKKRAPLSNLTNQKNASHSALRKSLPSSTLAPCTTKITQTKKKFPACTTSSAISGNKMPTSSNAKSTAVVFPKATSFPQRDESASATVALPCSMDTSIKSDRMSVSLDETTSTCDSFKSHEIEYIDNSDVSALDSIDRKTFSNLNISNNTVAPVNACSGGILVDLERDGKFVNIDDNYLDPQLCAPYACDIYKHLRASEAKKRPSTDFMERIQKDINSNMRAILVDWLVEIILDWAESQTGVHLSCPRDILHFNFLLQVAEEYRLVPDTLYLTVNYLDRYLSGNEMSRQKLQLLGVACMMIAAKYEEICAPQVEEYCYITDNTYFKEEVLQMESAVLNYLKFEMTAPTIKCFLRRFVRAAQGVNEVASLQLECLTNYIAELSLLEYTMLCYAPSLIAASAIFLAKLILFPSKKPWNSTLQHYTLYKASDLRNCVKDLHRLCYNSHSSGLPAIREKYSQHKYKYVAKKSCPPSIPPELFQS